MAPYDKILLQLFPFCCRFDTIDEHHRYLVDLDETKQAENQSVHFQPVVRLCSECMAVMPRGTEATIFLPSRIVLQVVVGNASSDGRVHFGSGVGRKGFLIVFIGECEHFVTSFIDSEFTRALLPQFRLPPAMLPVTFEGLGLTMKQQCQRRLEF
jgi:hypothetical protein